MRNSQIAQMASTKLVYDTASGWLELYAESFAYSAYINTITNRSYYINYTTDNLMFETYFACTRGWASTLLSNDTTPPDPALAPYSSTDNYPACDDAPGWYRTLLGH